MCVSVKGLNPRTKYEVSLRVTPADNYRYKYLNSTWIPVGESDILQKEAKHIYIHPNSKELETCTGECWMKKQINFKNVKISHNPASSHGDVSSMRAAKKKKKATRGLAHARDGPIFLPAAIGSHNAQVCHRDRDKARKFISNLLQISRNDLYCRNVLSK